MPRFNLSNGRYASPSNSRYAEYIKGRKIDGTDAAAVNAEKSKVPETHGTYGALLLHPKWKERRQQILRRDNYCCVVCRSSDSLEIHHRQYHFIGATEEFKPPWDYADHLMITMCTRCHQRGHSKFKVPTIII